MGGVEILGGIGLTLFGVRFLRKGLDRLFGGNLITWLSRAVTHRGKAFAGGIGAGVVAPSSTGLALLVAQMLSAGKLPAANMLAVLLGANIGLTVAVQLLAVRIDAYAGLLIIAGVAAFQFLKRETFRGIGQCVLALGFVFLAIHLIGEGAAELSSSAELKEFIRLVQGHPSLVLMAVCLLAVIFQSSTATIGLGLGLAASGLLASDILLPWVLGTTLGLSITSLIAGWSNLEGRRLGVSNLITKLMVIIPFLCLPQAGLRFFEMWPGSLNRQTAMFYTDLNLLIGLLALPLLGGIGRLACYMIPEPESEDPFSRETFLDDNVLESPSLALARATRETLHMADKVRLMLETFWKAFCSGNTEMARRIQKEDDVVDELNLNLNSYLSKISEGKSDADTQWQFSLLSFANDLESIGDLVDKHLCDLLIKQKVEGIVLDAPDRDLLAEAYLKLLARFEVAARLLTSRVPEEAKLFLAEKESFNDWCRQIQREHYERLSATSRAAVNSSAVFLDFLNAFRRINSHLSGIGYSLYRTDKREHA